MYRLLSSIDCLNKEYTRGNVCTCKVALMNMIGHKWIALWVKVQRKEKETKRREREKKKKERECCYIKKKSFSEK